MKKTIFIFVVILISIPFVSFARENITDWYIKEFNTLITVNQDSSLLVSEDITADADSLPNKHGIFRILPTQIKTPDKVFRTPIELISITDFNGNPLQYTIIRDSGNNTVTWKIGDPNKTVSGENYYRIVYKVKNAIRFDNPNFDEFYWNLLGTFWKLDIDKFNATIIFPTGVNEENTEINYYTGYSGEKRQDLANYKWIVDYVLQFVATGVIKSGEGITASIVFPKNIFYPSQLSFTEKYINPSPYLWFLIPIIVFICCFIAWMKYGKDPRINKTIIPEFEIPGNLSPMQVGLLVSNGKWNKRLIPASIINMAVKGLISIKEIEPPPPAVRLTAKLFQRKNFSLNSLSLGSKSIIDLPAGDKELMDKIFKWEKEVDLSLLKTYFIQYLPEIKEAAINDLADRQLIIKKGLTIGKIFFFVGILLLVIFSQLFAGFNSMITYSIIASGLIFLIFSFIMPQRTKKGAELLWKIKGFHLYMNIAEKYRQQFNERENIFEKFLPYAIVFGMTKLWVKKMEEIYGSDFIKNYYPAWFIGTSSSMFNVSSFTSALDNLSSSIASGTGTSSGSGGGGGAGGGGGGGGGGGW